MGRMILVPGADFSGVNLGQATLVDGLPVEGITIQGPGMVYGSANYSVKTYPTFTSQKEVTWSIISGDSYASVNSAGHVTASVGADQNAVVLRCSSVANPLVYTDRQIYVTAGTLVYYDYLQSDGNAYILINDFPQLLGATITVKYILGNQPNGYILGNRDNTVAASAFGLYLQSNGTTSRAIAGTTYNTITTNNATTIKHRAVLKTSSAPTVADASFTCYNDTSGAQLFNVSLITCYLKSIFSVFTFGAAESVISPFEYNSSNNGTGKFYGMTIVSNGDTIADIRPAKANDVPCLIDIISGKTYFNEAVSGLTAGND